MLTRRTPTSRELRERDRRIGEAHHDVHGRRTAAPPCASPRACAGPARRGRRRRRPRRPGGAGWRRRGRRRRRAAFRPAPSARRDGKRARGFDRGRDALDGQGEVVDRPPGRPRRPRWSRRRRRTRRPSRSSPLRPGRRRSRSPGRRSRERRRLADGATVRRRSSALARVRPSVFSTPRLVVPSASKPRPARRRAVPASQGFGRRRGSVRS